MNTSLVGVGVQGSEFRVSGFRIWLIKGPLCGISKLEFDKGKRAGILGVGSPALSLSLSLSISLWRLGFERELEFGIRDSGFGIRDLGFNIWDSGFRGEGHRFVGLVLRARHGIHLDTPQFYMKYVSIENISGNVVYYTA